MIDDPTLVSILRRHEGKRSDVYRDTEGFWTVGIGHLVTRDKSIDAQRARELCGAPWSNEKCHSQAELDLDEAADMAFNAWPWAADLPDWPRRGLISMTYQMGVGGVKKFRKMLAALEAGDWESAERNALDSLWAKQTPTRAREVATMIGNKAIAT